MLHSRLQAGMTLMQVLVLTRSLGTHGSANAPKPGPGPTPVARECGWSSTAGSCSAGRCNAPD